MKNSLKIQAFGALVFLGAGMLFTGCKSAPELTEANALALVQAKYDATPPVGANIIVNDLGMRQGITAKYWNRTTMYPNKFWADFKLTDDGKKVIKLPAGGDVIQWRPDSLTDTNYTIIVVTQTANHLKAHDIKNLQSEVLPGVDTAMGASYTEAVDLTGVPDALQGIAHNPGNHLSTKRQADFALENGAWTVHSTE